MLGQSAHSSLYIYVDEELCDDNNCDKEVLACDGESDDDEAHSSEDPTDVSSVICQLSSNGPIEKDLTAISVS